MCTHAHTHLIVLIQTTAADTVTLQDLEHRCRILLGDCLSKRSGSQTQDISISYTVRKEIKQFPLFFTQHQQGTLAVMYLHDPVKTSQNKFLTFRKWPRDLQCLVNGAQDTLEGKRALPLTAPSPEHDFQSLFQSWAEIPNVPLPCCSQLGHQPLGQTLETQVMLKTKRHHSQLFEGILPISPTVQRDLCASCLLNRECLMELYFCGSALTSSAHLGEPQVLHRYRGREGDSFQISHVT